MTGGPYRLWGLPLATPHGIDMNGTDLDFEPEQAHD
jgi:hypothetical protein